MLIFHEKGAQMKLTKKTEERIKAAVAKFQKILVVAKARDLNESDTVTLIVDMLSEIFGYDKYLEVTSELCIRGTYCDLAIKINDKFEYLIECKSIGTELKDIHLRQAVSYGANKGIQWIVLANGIEWLVYRLRFEQPIQWDLVAKIDFEKLNLKNDRDLERLVILTKEGVEKDARAELYEKIQCVNRFVVGQLLLNEPVVSVLRRELKKLSDGINVEEPEVVTLLRDSVLRRELLDAENESVTSAVARVNRFYKQAAKKPQPKHEKPVEKKDEPETPPPPPKSLADQLLEEAESSGMTGGDQS